MIPAGLSRHYQGNLYQVIGVARPSETNEPLVVYRALYDAFGLWVRPLNRFTDMVEQQEGNHIPRFELIKEQSSERKEQPEK